MTLSTIAAWLLTYLLHSTVLLTAGLVLTRTMGDRHLELQETLLRTALFGGILTASLQIGLGIVPLAGIVALDPDIQQTATAISGAPISDGFASTIPSAAAQPAPIGGILMTALVVLWVLSAMAGLLIVLRSVRDLKLLLRTRCFRPAGRIVESLAAAMGFRRRVQVSTSKAIAVPFATGIRRPEICCPERVEELASEHRRSLFAHELAHLARRDPAWQLLYRIGEAFFVLQPLNRVVRRRLEELAEHLTDERAVACTGDRLGLARCLVVVAHWGVSSSLGLPATAFAAGPRLDRRVTRLISRPNDRCVNTHWIMTVAAAALVVAVAILPAIGLSPAYAEIADRASTDTPVEDVQRSTAKDADRIWTIAVEESTPDSTDVVTKTWSVIDERPNLENKPPAAPAPPTQPSSAAPASAPAPAAVPAAPSPPASDATPENPAPPATPAPEVKPAQQAPPVPPAPPKRTRESQSEEARRRAHERSEHRARTSEEHSRAREETRARERERSEISREHAERARAEARESVRQHRLNEIQREELRLRARALHAEAQRQAREESRAQLERARALREEARALAREASARGEKITEKQREELYRQALELRARAELRNREGTEALREQAKILAEEARILAEKAEADRRKKENERE